MVPSTNRFPIGIPDQPNSRSARWRAYGQEHLAPLLAAFAAALLITWPLPAIFNTALLGNGDVTWGVGTLWYWRQAFLGHEQWFFAENLFYPRGISLVANAMGPLSALFALPFWPFGYAAAYNATLLIGFALTGYCMVLLARDLGCSRPAAWFAGLLLMLAPLHVAAATGHIGKVFLGALPLALLVTRRAADPGRPLVWTLLVGPVLLLALLQAPEQLFFAATGCAILAVTILLSGSPGARKATATRLVWSSLSAIVCVAPIVLAVYLSLQGTGIATVRRGESIQHQPDLLQFILPYGTGAFRLSGVFERVLAPFIMAPMETAVYLSWAGLLLCGFAFAWARRQAAPWLWMLGVCILLALGPTLRIAGQERFAGLAAPIHLPFYLLNQLPVVEFMRTPGRFMLLGYVAFAAAAAIGLDAVRARLKRPWAGAAVLCAIFAIAFELLPPPFPVQKLLPVPDFYQQLAADSSAYGILDLPVRPTKENDFSAWHIYFSSFYQVDQIVHGKGIATGYSARSYATHPVFAHFISENAIYDSPLPQDLRVDGQPSSRYANLRYYLAQNNYRYVVLHKPLADHPVYRPGAWGEQAAWTLIDEVFGNEPPLVDDALVTVYAVDPAPPVTALTTSIALLEPSAGQSWTDHRWGASPQGFLVHAPQPMLAHLDVTVQSILNPARDRYFEYALLTAESGAGAVRTQVPIAPFQTATIPIALAPGSQVITLTVTPPPGDESAGQMLDFKIERIDLSTAPPHDAGIPAQSGTQEGLLAAYGNGWYGAEQSEDGTSMWRWATSPADVWVYSDDIAEVQLAATPLALHVADTPDGKGNAGELAIGMGAKIPVTQPIVVGEPFAVPLTLQPGWNRIELALAAGNFRPVDYQPETGDARALSFALEELSIHE